jgi:hypothetical protein
MTKERFFTSILKSIISLISKELEDLSHHTLHIKNIVPCVMPFWREGAGATD